MARISARPPRLLAPLRNLNPFRRSPKKVKPDADMMTLQEHLIEFRTRLVRSILAIFGGMIFGFIFANRVIVWMTSKATSVDTRAHIITIEPAEGFITYSRSQRTLVWWSHHRCCSIRLSASWRRGYCRTS